MMEALGNRARSIEAAALAAIRAEFDAFSISEARTREEIARVWRETHIADPHTAVGLGAARREELAGPGAARVLNTAHAGQIPRRDRAATGCSAAAAASCRPRKARIFRCFQTIRARSNASSADVAALSQKVGVMSARVTTLPSGLRIVTDAMPHLETASLGVRVGAGSRHERASEHGLSHLLEHMAFKGTRRRSARAIAEEIEARVAISTPRLARSTPPITPMCWRGRAARHRHPRRHRDRQRLRHR